MVGRTNCEKGTGTALTNSFIKENTVLEIARQNIGLACLFVSMITQKGGYGGLSNMYNKWHID